MSNNAAVNENDLIKLQARAKLTLQKIQEIQNTNQHNRKINADTGSANLKILQIEKRQ